MVICTYPELIAAYHVLHRLREPRHPPCALNYFRQCAVFTDGKLILSAVDSFNLIYSLACVNMSKIAVRTLDICVEVRIGFAYPISLRGE